MPSWVQVWSEEKQRHVLIPRSEYTPRTGVSWQVMPDLPEYESPIDGRLVSGRVQRREDLKRNHCRPYEKGEREAYHRRRDSEEKAFERRVDDTIRSIVNG